MAPAEHQNCSEGFHGVTDAVNHSCLFLSTCYFTHQNKRRIFGFASGSKPSETESLDHLGRFQSSLIISMQGISQQSLSWCIMLRYWCFFPLSQNLNQTMTLPLPCFKAEMSFWYTVYSFISNTGFYLFYLFKFWSRVHLMNLY